MVEFTQASWLRITSLIVHFPPVNSLPEWSTSTVIPTLKHQKCLNWKRGGLRFRQLNNSWSWFSPQSQDLGTHANTPKSVPNKQISKIIQGTSFSFGHFPKASTKGWLSFSRTAFEVSSSPWLTGSTLTMVDIPRRKIAWLSFCYPWSQMVYVYMAKRLTNWAHTSNWTKKTSPNTCSTTSSEQCPGRSRRKHLELEHSEVAPGGPHSEIMGYQGNVTDVIQIYFCFT